MEDRFKFRVWKYYDGNVSEGFYLTEEENVILWNFGELWRQDDSSDFSDSAIIEQCTGLKDKNGKLIYEGDIYVLHGIKYIVVFDKLCFYGQCADDKKYISHISIDQKYIEIIGNIREADNE